MRLRIDLHVLTTIFTLISSTNLQRSDASIKTVEEFLDTLINSSRYDRRIRPFFDQQSESISFPFVMLFSLPYDIFRSVIRIEYTFSSSSTMNDFPCY